MADFGITEAALLAGAAEGAAAAGGTAAADAAITAGALAGTTAATAGTAAATGLTAAETAAAAAPVAATAADAAASTTPIFLGVTEAAPVVAGGDAALTAAAPSLTGTGAIGGTSSLSGPTGGLIAESLSGAPLVESPSGTIASSLVGKTGVSEGLLGDLATSASDWWSKATLGEKLSAGGALLSGATTAAKTAIPTNQGGSKTTVRPGTTGKPMSAMGLTQVIDNLLKRRDTYQNASGVPVAYRPRSLLG